MGASSDKPVFAFSGFSLDPRQRLLLGPDGRSLALSGRAFDTLHYLLEHPNEIVDKRTLMKAVWPDVIVEENNLNQNISSVRRALGEGPGDHRFIATVPGRGFMFVADVTVTRKLASREHAARSNDQGYIAPSASRGLRSSIAVLPYTVPTAWGFIWEPAMAAFRRDARFQALAGRLGLTEYWSVHGQPDDLAA